MVDAHRCDCSLITDKDAACTSPTLRGRYLTPHVSRFADAPLRTAAVRGCAVEDGGGAAAAPLRTAAVRRLGR